MIVTLELPDELATQLMALPESERNRYATAAFWHYTEEVDNVAGEDSEEKEDECIAIVEQALADVEAGRNMVHFEDVLRRYEADKLERLAKIAA